MIRPGRRSAAEPAGSAVVAPAEADGAAADEAADAARRGRVEPQLRDVVAGQERAVQRDPPTATTATSATTMMAMRRLFTRFPQSRASRCASASNGAVSRPLLKVC